MADIELVIKIPEDEYKNILLTGKASFCVVNAIEAGTPLPKEHGRLIDADKTIANSYEVYSAFGTPCIITADQMYAIRKALTAAQTIIEADKAEGEG